MQTYSEIARAILRLLVSLHHLSLLDGNAAIEELVFGLAGALVRVQQSGMISDIVRFGSEQVLEHIRPTCVGSKLHRRCWPGRTPFPVRQVVSTSEQHTRVIDLTTGRAGPDYLPCLKTWWTAFLFNATSLIGSHDAGPVWGTSRTATYVARAFLEAGASIEVEICIGRNTCHGHVCICSDPSTHSRLYECSESIDDCEKKHTHAWISAQSIMLDYLGIPGAEVLQAVERKRNTQSRPKPDLPKLARDVEAMWQRHVEACIRIKRPVLDEHGRYSWIAEAEFPVGRIESQVT
jgi:hypothetical protein